MAKEHGERLVEAVIELAILIGVFALVEPALLVRRPWVTVVVVLALVGAALCLLKVARRWLRVSMLAGLTVIAALVLFLTDEDKPPLRAQVALDEDADGNPILDVTLRNLSEDPIVISSARVQVDEILKLRPCGNVPVSTLTPTGVYDLAVPFSTGGVSAPMAQLIPPKTADRFQLTVAPTEADALYRISVTLLFDESKEALRLGSFVLFVDDHLVADVPDTSDNGPAPKPVVECIKANFEAHGESPSLIDDCTWVYECMQSNATDVLDFLRSGGDRSGRAADLEARARSYMESPAVPGPRAPGPTVPSSPPSAPPLPEGYTMGFDVSLFVGRPSTRNAHACRGQFVDQDWVLTSRHCLLNRRTGRQRDLSELVVQHARDLTEHLVTEARTDDDPEVDLIVLKVAPPLRIDGPTVRDRLGHGDLGPMPPE